MTKAEWETLYESAKVGLTLALSEGRGVDALAMLEALQRVKDGERKERLAEQQTAMMNAQRGA